MVSLQGIYIGCTVFSVGITTLDFLGILGGRHESDGDGMGHGGDHGGDMGHDGDLDGGDIDHAGDVDSGDHDADSNHASEATSSETSHYGGVAVLSVLSYLRSLVYFCLGFGPTGWVAMATGRAPAGSLLWALPAGAIAFVVARAFFRFQRSDTDSSLRSEELLFQRAIVIVPLSHTTMGKVRAQVGMNVTEQYALATETGAQFKKGDTVWITNVTEECVYVEDEITKRNEHQ